MNKLFSFIVLFSFFSCGSSKDKIPDNILPKDKMVKVQVALHLLEASLSSKKTLDQTLNSPDTFSFQSVFKREDHKNAI